LDDKFKTNCKCGKADIWNLDSSLEFESFKEVLMAILEISVVPIGTKETSLSSYVADCLRIVKEEKVKYEFTSMGTNMEGDLKSLIRIALKMHQTPFKKGAKRVLTTIKIDDRRDKVGTLTGKKKAVQRKLKMRG